MSVLTEATLPRRSRGRARVRPWQTLAPAVLAAAFVFTWWAGALVLDSAVFPDPLTATRGLAGNLEDPRFRDNVVTTVVRLLVAFLAVMVVGAATGFALGLSRFWADVVSPLLYAVYSVPKIVLFPLFLLFLGLGDASQISFAFFSGVLPMTLMVMNGTASVPRLALKLAASLQLGTFKVVSKIVLPSALPAFATALRLTFGLTFLGVIIAEMFTGTSGLGNHLLREVALARMGNIVGTVLLIVVIALGPATALRAFERRIHARYGGAA